MASFKTTLMISIFVVLYFPSTIFCFPRLQKLTLPVPGPEAFAFDIQGRGPYTGVSDGRVLKYEGPRTGFADYAYTSPNRSKAICDGTHDITLAPICGRPLGLGFYYRTGELYIADAFLGLFVVGRNGGRATQLATSAGRVPFRFLDGLEVDQLTGTVYFTDASAIYGLRTRKVTVLLTGLAGPAGVAISKDGTYLLVSEFVSQRIQKYWLKGPSANKAEVLLNLKGNPDNIKRTVRGDFWVAVTVSTPSPAVLGHRITGSGAILKTIKFSPRFNSTSVSEVQEVKGALYLGSLSLGVNYVGLSKA